MNLGPADILDSAGPLSRALGGRYESRTPQLEMTKAVSRTLADRATLLVEAGTGVGKSFAYLVPAMLRCALHGERVVVATNTIALQEQLVSRDVPMLLNTINDWGLGDDAIDVRACLVKGRGNYLSIRRLKLASERQHNLFPDPAQKRSLHVIEDWAYHSDDGTLSTLPAVERASIWDRVQSDSGNCMGRRCPTYDQCFYQRSRREMERSNLLICNHAVFFSDLALRASGVGYLPAYDHVILDEAHMAEDVASEHFGVSLTEGRVNHLLGALYNQRAGKGYLPNLSGEVTDESLVDAAMSSVRKTADAARAFFDELYSVARSGELMSGRIPRADWIDNHLTPAARELNSRLRALKSATPETADGFELNAYAERAQAIADDAEVLVAQSMPGCVYWVEGAGGSNEPGAAGSGTSDGGGGGDDSDARRRNLRMSCSPIDVGPMLDECLFSKRVGVVLTSATLATRNTRGDAHREHAEAAFSHTIQRLGCGHSLDRGHINNNTEETHNTPNTDHDVNEVRFEPDPTASFHNDSNSNHSNDSTNTPNTTSEGLVRTLQLGSPFDFSKQMEIIVDLSAPAPGPGNDQRLADQIAERISHHVRATDGGAFVLFTAFNLLYAVADRLSPELTKLGMPVLVQGRDGSRQAILDAFKADRRSVLLGAASFWQGVDVPGDSLRNVVITRLPFEPPDRPLTQARHERINERGGNPFMEDSLPRAIIRFKQGAGRLIRTAADRGRVVVLDPRIKTARYGRLFLQSLPTDAPVRYETRENR